MSPETLTTNEEDRRPLIVTEDTDLGSTSNSSAESVNLMEHSLQVDTSSTANPFASFDEVFHNKQASINSGEIHYQSVGELLWQKGQMYSDVRLTFEDRGVLATSAGIPSELRLHSLVLFQSQFFKEQLSVTSAATSSSPASNMLKEKQIIVRLPSRVTEEDMINFYCTLKLMYTKDWDLELANNLTKGVGCLSVCCEIGFHEGIEACWKWLTKKCNRDGNKEMMKRLIEAYPNLHEQFTEPDETSNSSNSNIFSSNSYLNVPLQKSSSKIKRTPPNSRRPSRRTRKRSNSNGNGSYSRQSASPMLKTNRRDILISSDSSASPPHIHYEKELPRLPLTPLTSSSSSSPPPSSLPSPPLSNSSFSPITSDNSPTIPSIPTDFDFPSLSSIAPPSIFSNAQILNTWITKFETYAISSKRACSKMPTESRKDTKCFPFLEHFVSIFDSINQLGKAKHITSPEALDYTLRMLNVIKIEHAHFHTLHMPLQHNQLKSPLSPKSPNKSRPTSPQPNSTLSRPTSPRPVSSRPTSPRPISSRPTSPHPLSPPRLSPNSNSTPPIVLHESLDDPLSHIMKNVLAPIEQKHLCDYLWAPSNISNLMHLREIRGDDDVDMEENEFDGYDQVMGEISLVRASRVSKVEHMVVGEKMAKYIREIRSKNLYNKI